MTGGKASVTPPLNEAIGDSSTRIESGSDGSRATTWNFPAALAEMSMMYRAVEIGPPEAQNEASCVWLRTSAGDCDWVMLVSSATPFVQESADAEGTNETVPLSAIQTRWKSRGNA